MNFLYHQKGFSPTHSMMDGGGNVSSYLQSLTEYDKLWKLDGFVKSPSAALHFNFVVAAHLVSALHSSVFVRLASGSFYETIVLVIFYEIIKFIV